MVGPRDESPLKYHIEQYDQLHGLAIIWMQVPMLAPGSADNHVWMYYGNRAAPAGFDAAGSYDVATVAVYHYAETAGLPRDSSAFGNHFTEGTVNLNQPGVLDRAAAFDSPSFLRVPANPALASPAGEGFTVSTWLKLTRTQDLGRILTFGTEPAGFHVEVVNNNLLLRQKTPGKESIVQTTTPLAAGRWYHVAVIVGAKPKLFLDGELVAGTDHGFAFDVAGDLVLGASNGVNGFTGLLDATQIANSERSAAWIKVAAQGQGPDGRLVVYGADETLKAAGFAYLALIGTLAKAIGVDGLVIIAIIPVSYTHLTLPTN